MKPNIKWEPLLNAAREARKMAYAPYSGFPVGAALIGERGKIYTGCNVENSSYGLTVCAERVALYKAVSEGETQPKAIVVVADTEKSLSLCGACRQVLAEFNTEILVLAANTKGVKTVTTLSQLLPEPFGKKSME